MAELHRVTPNSLNGAVVDVVFVHGLGGDKLSTWQSTASSDSFWPAWLGDDLPDVAVYSLGYDASPLAWLGNAMPLSDRATNMLASLVAEELGARPLIWVCHSLGGLVVKKILQHAAIQNQPSWKCFVENTRAVVFLSTPHAGSRVADYVNLLGRVLRTTPAIKDLQANDTHLRELSQWYRNNAQNLNIETHVFFEKRDTAGVRIVDESSDDPGISGVIPVPADNDHFAICKPADRNALVYKSVRQLVSQYATPKPAPAPLRATAAGIQHVVLQCVVFV